MRRVAARAPRSWRPTTRAPGPGPAAAALTLAACLADAAAGVTVAIDGATTPVRVVYPYVLGS